MNRHNVRTWGTETPHVIIEHGRDSPKVNVFCAVSHTRVFGPFFFCGEHRYRDHVSGHADGVTFPAAIGRIRRLHFAARRDSAAHFHREVRKFLSEHLPQCWMGRSIQNTGLPLEEWPSRSPDIIPNDFLLWGSVKSLVFVPLLPRNLKDMNETILATVSTIDDDKLQSVWDS